MKPDRRILMTLAFYPRGGSAQVVRYLGEALVDRGDDVTVCCGSLGAQGAASHAATFFRALGVEGVFFDGWRGHEDLATGFNCADVFVAPSVDEPFGQVYLEAMACGLPAIATDSGGPTSFVNTDPVRLNGWRVTPDSETDLADAMIEGVSDPAIRLERGRHARRMIENEYDWRHVAGRVDRIYGDVLAE